MGGRGWPWGYHSALLKLLLKHFSFLSGSLNFKNLNFKLIKFLNFFYILSIIYCYLIVKSIETTVLCVFKNLLLLLLGDVGRSTGEERGTKDASLMFRKVSPQGERASVLTFP